jgi:hypothetical protein
VCLIVIPSIDRERSPIHTCGYARLREHPPHTRNPREHLRRNTDVLGECAGEVLTGHPERRCERRNRQIPARAQNRPYRRTHRPIVRSSGDESLQQQILEPCSEARDIAAIHNL